MNSRCVFVLRRRPDLSASQFTDLWRGPHAELVARHAKTLGLVGYTQLHTLHTATTTGLRIYRGLLAPYDGIDSWTLDYAVFKAALETQPGLTAFNEIVASERKFIDHSRSAAWLAEAHLFRDDGTVPPAPVRKLVWVGRGLPPQTDREFQAHYRNWNGPLVSHSAELMGIHRYVQLHTMADPLSERLRALRGTGWPYPVSAELIWELSDMFRSGREGSAASAAVNRDEEEHIDFARSAIWQAEEHVIIEPPKLPWSEAASLPKPDLTHPKEPASLKGKVAVVTGAATGIGREVALELARRGCDLALVTRENGKGLEQTACDVRALGRNTSVHLADITDRARMAQLPEEVEKAHGAIHLLVNNAGVALFGEFEATSLENLDRIVDINLWGVLHGCKFFLPYLEREGYGHICNVVGVGGLLALPHQSAYAATKFAVRGFSEALRGELAPRGVGVSCVFPGLIKTELFSAGRTDGEKGTKQRTSLARYVARFGMEPSECARRIVDGIEKNEARTLITPESHVVDALKRMFPRAVDVALAALTRRGLPSP